jgi:hypothetical protein
MTINCQVRHPKSRRDDRERRTCTKTQATIAKMASLVRRTSEGAFQGVQGATVLHSLARLYEMAIQGATQGATKCYTGCYIFPRLQSGPTNRNLSLTPLFSGVPACPAANLTVSTGSSRIEAILQALLNRGDLL